MSYGKSSFAGLCSDDQPNSSDDAATALLIAIPLDELIDRMWICSPAEMIDCLGPYAELGIDRLMLSVNFGLAASEVLEASQCIVQEVTPHFHQPAAVAAQ
ncbi:hypothetical protein OO012_13285 [Rhodobacteraceae bacterium KMM 6894]|nr:hypothetical protein [Rhodobacteraceae bacterium KMM 6894]